MQNKCLEEYDVKALLYSQGDYSLFLERMDSDFGCILEPTYTELFQSHICKNENKLVFWYLRYDLCRKMLYHPLFAAIITSSVFLRPSIKRGLLEHEIPPSSNTRRKWRTLAAIGGEVTRGGFFSQSSSVQGRSNPSFLPFLFTISAQTVFPRSWTVK